MKLVGGKAVANHSWILEVLSDLAEYAKGNSFEELEAVVLKATIVARVEIIHAKDDSNYQAVMDVVFPDKTDHNEVPASK